MSKKADASADMFQRLESLMTPEKYKMLRARLFPLPHDIESQKLANNQRDAIWRRQLSELNIIKAIQKNIKAYERETFKLRKKELFYYENKMRYINLLNKLDEEQTLKSKSLQRQYHILISKINENIANCLQYIVNRINYMNALIKHVDKLINIVEEDIKETKIEFENTFLHIIDNIPNISEAQQRFLQSLISDYHNNIITLDNFYDEFINQVTKTGDIQNEMLTALLQKLDLCKQDIQEKIHIHTELISVRQNLATHVEDLTDSEKLISDDQSNLNKRLNATPTFRSSTSDGYVHNLLRAQPDANVKIINDEIYSNKLNNDSQEICDKLATIEARLLVKTYNQPPVDKHTQTISLKNRK